ncbi:MAG: hypothetical protein ABIP85_14555 [Chthoniobacteraceae bacterium]
MCAACCIGGAAAHAQFAPEDEVRLRRDEPLHFKDSVFRQGKTGEIFKVVKYDRANGSVFLLANGSDGKPFALRCADSALEPAPKDAWALVREGLNAMQQGELEYARTRFVRASTGATVDDMAVKLALHCESLRKSAAEVGVIREAQRKALIEVGRLTRNAQVADHPSLIPGDTSNQMRAEEMRRRAAALREKSESAMTAAVDALSNAVESARADAKSLTESGSLSVGVAMWDAVTSFSRKQMPSERQPAETELPGRAELTRRINAASDALARARTNFDARRLLAALGALESGLEAESGRGDLKQLREVVASAIERARARVQTARSLADQQRRDEALAELAKVEAICADDSEALALGKELRGSPQK